MFNEFLTIGSPFMGRLTFQKIFLTLKRLFGEPVFLGLSSCRISDMDTNNEIITECFYPLLISELENGPERFAYEAEQPFVMFHLTMFLIDYQTRSLKDAMGFLLENLSMAVSELDKLKEQDAEQDEMREVMRHIMAMRILGRCIRRVGDI